MIATDRLPNFVIPVSY